MLAANEQVKSERSVTNGINGTRNLLLLSQTEHVKWDSFQSASIPVSLLTSNRSMESPESLLTCRLCHQFPNNAFDSRGNPLPYEAAENIESPDTATFHGSRPATRATPIVKMFDMTGTDATLTRLNGPTQHEYYHWPSEALWTYRFATAVYQKWGMPDFSIWSRAWTLEKVAYYDERSASSITAATSSAEGQDDVLVAEQTPRSHQKRTDTRDNSGDVDTTPSKRRNIQPDATDDASFHQDVALDEAQGSASRRDADAEDSEFEGLYSWTRPIMCWAWGVHHAMESNPGQSSPRVNSDEDQSLATRDGDGDPGVMPSMSLNSDWEVDAEVEGTRLTSLASEGRTDSEPKTPPPNAILQRREHRKI